MTFDKVSTPAMKRALAVCCEGHVQTIEEVWSLRACMEKETAMFWQRRFPQLREDAHIAYKVIEQETFANHPVRPFALNISGGEIGFEATESLPQGVLIALELRLSSVRTPLLALARVIWCKPTGYVYQVRAELWWIGWGDQQSQTTMANYIASHHGGGIISISTEARE